MLDYIKTLRAMVGNTKLVIPGVRALIFDRNGSVLLQKQALFGSWALPHGCIDVGESVFEALKREIKEETGLDVASARPFGIYSDPKYSVTYPNGDEVQTLTLAFIVTAWSGELATDDPEVTELGFFPLHALPDPIYPIHVDTIADYELACFFRLRCGERLHDEVEFRFGQRLDKGFLAPHHELQVSAERCRYDLADIQADPEPVEEAHILPGCLDGAFLAVAVCHITIDQKNGNRTCSVYLLPRRLDDQLA